MSGGTRRLGVALAAFLCLGAGCGADWQLAGSCERFAGAHRIQYVGGALGEGEVALHQAPDRRDALVGQLTLWDDSGTDAVIELAGPGTCEGNLVQLTFGAGDHPDARVRVLGGTATLVPPLGRVPELFGAWNVEVVIKETGEHRALQGFLQGLPDAEAALGRGTETGDVSDPADTPS